MGYASPVSPALQADSLLTEPSGKFNDHMRWSTFKNVILKNRLGHIGVVRGGRLHGDLMFIFSNTCSSWFSFVGLILYFSLE